MLAPSLTNPNGTRISTVWSCRVQHSWFYKKQQKCIWCASLWTQIFVLYMPEGCNTTQDMPLVRCICGERVSVETGICVDQVLRCYPPKLPSRPAETSWSQQTSHQIIGPFRTTTHACSQSPKSYNISPLLRMSYVSKMK